jgi:hypothetical protein
VCHTNALRRPPLGERMLSGEQLVRHHTERVEIGAEVDVWIAGRLFGRHVRGRADLRSHLCDRLAGIRLRRRRAIARATPKSATIACLR